MGLYHAYMDESGTDANSPVIVVAGYVFAEDQARRFSTSWKKDLDHFSLPFAHMTDCATGNGVYKNMSKEQRVESEKALIAHIRHRSTIGIAVAFDYQYYKKFFDGKFELDAYTFCLALCVNFISQWIRTQKGRNKIEFIFESGHAAQSQADGIMDTIRGSRQGETYASHSFLGKREALPLQAADMLAWQFGHFLKRRPQGHAMRKDFIALMRPRDRLKELSPEEIDKWRDFIDLRDEAVMRKVKNYFPGPEEMAFARSLLSTPRHLVKI